MPENVRTDGQRLAAGAAGRQKLWLHGPGQLKVALSLLEKASGPADWGAALQGCTAELWACISAFGHKEAVGWWVKTGRFREPAFGGGRLIGMGCPRGPRVGEALAAARRAAWEGRKEAEQLEAARKAWEEGH